MDLNGLLHLKFSTKGYILQIIRMYCPGEYSGSPVATAKGLKKGLWEKVEKGQ